MNTPAHAILNLVLLGRRAAAGGCAAIAIGAVVPDVPLLVFYVVEGVIRGTPERVLWFVTYFEPRWQALFDGFHSIPLTALGVAGAWWWKCTNLRLFFASMLLHAACDLPLHHDDAHRHFQPFSGWRLESPVSYWDPAHFGVAAALLEALVVAGCCVVLYRRWGSRRGRLAAAAIALGYVAGVGFAIALWG